MAESKKMVEFDAHAWKRDAMSHPDEGPPPDPTSKLLTCTITGSKARWISPDGTSAIWNASYEVDGEDKLRSAAILGSLGRVSPGEMLSCQGFWKKAPKYGWQFHVKDYTSTLPSNASGVADWLSTRIPGIGPTFAEAIVTHFGHDNVYTILDEDPTRLKEVRTKAGRKLPEKQVEKAITAWEGVKVIRQIETFLFSHKVSANLAGKLYRKYGPDVVEILKEDPYRVTEMRGIGFKIADTIARSMGIALDDPKRMMAAILFVLKEAESDGHTFLALKQIIGRTAMALTPPGEKEPPKEVRDPQKIVAAASNLSNAGKIIAEDDEYLQQRIYVKRMHEMESYLARRLRHLLETPNSALMPKPTRPEAPTGASEDEILKLGLPSDAQWSAIDMVRLHRLSLLTGGPGCGKCTRGDTPIFVNGTLIKASDIWERYATDPIWDEDGYWANSSIPLITNSIEGEEIVSKPFSRLWKQRIKEMGRRVTLEDGTELVLTKRHQLFGPDGWTTDMKAGDHVCIPRQLRWEGHSVDRDLVTLLAWQIAEGHELPNRRRAEITQKDRSVLERLRADATAIGTRHDLQMNTMPIRQHKKDGPWSLLISSTSYAHWLESQGYEWGHLSASKIIPDFIMSADDATIALFLREFLAAEGSVSVPFRRLEVTSASHWLMMQLSTLMRRLGIWLVVHQKSKAATNGTGIKRPYWTGYVSGPCLRTLADRIGIADIVKEEKLASACEASSNPNRDIVPFKDLMLELRSITKLGRRHFTVNSCYMSGERDVSHAKGRAILAAVHGVGDGSAAASYADSRPTGRGGHRYRAHNLSAFAEMDYVALSALEEQMRTRIEREVFYAKVISVEDVWLDEDVYDFEVAEVHNYVASGVLCHNTHSQEVLIQMLTDADKVTKLAAPTGKAARRMQEVTGHAATTIHRLLEYSPFEGGFQRNEDNPIEADCLIVDEASMLSLDLAYALFKAVGEDTHVLMVGDPDQLAPVGAGKVLDDLIKSERVPRVHLTKIFRQAAQSMIIQNSRRLNTGQLPYFRKEEAEHSLQQAMLNDFFWITRNTPEDTAELTLDLACNRLPRAFDLDPRKDIMVLAPMHEGKVGLNYFNSELERRLNAGPDGRPKKPIITRKYKLSGKDIYANICVGSRIVQTKNDHQNEVMNGELAIVLDYDELENSMLLSLDDGMRELWMPVPDAETYHLAWALTTHKSQGSEFPAVIVPVSSAHYVMLNRALYYTAVTRAKKLCVMIGEKKALSMAVKNPDLKKRNSTLAARILDPSLSGELF